jgi:hypothetical protein
VICGSRPKIGRLKSQLPEKGRQIFSIPQIKFYHYSTVQICVLMKGYVQNICNNTCTITARAQPLTARIENKNI